MEKINKCLWAVAAVAMFVVCVPLFAGGIDNNTGIGNANNASMLLTDNKTNINPESEITNPSSISSDDKKNTTSKYKNTKPKNGEFKIERSAKVNAVKIHVPKEKVIEAIARGDKKVTEKDIISIAEELNMSASEFKKDVKNAGKEIY